MIWARRLKRVFRVDVETCEHCGGKVRIVASIEDPDIIERILGHIERRGRSAGSPHAARGPPGSGQARRISVPTGHTGLLRVGSHFVLSAAWNPKNE